MTPQEIFDKVVVHLAIQGKQATEDNVCTYKSKDGLKCAVGCLIPDELYNDTMIGAVDTLFNDHPAVKEYLGGCNMELLYELQIAHDTNYGNDFGLEDKLMKIADNYDLDSSILNKVNLPDNWGY